jgi:hypothetical protein
VRHTQTPSWLILPSEVTVKHIAHREGLGELTEAEFDFVWDLLAKLGGAEVQEFDEAAAQAEAAVNALSEAAAFAGRTGIDAESVVPWFEDSYHLIQHQLYEALTQIDLAEIPGYNHPTKAVRLLKLFRDMEKLWVLYIINIELLGFVQFLNDALEQMDKMDPRLMVLLKRFSSDQSDEAALMLGLELRLQNIQLEEMLRVARKLDELAPFQGRLVKPIRDPDGEDMGVRAIENLTELSRTSQANFALPRDLLMARAAQGELDVREPQTHRDKKQLLFMVVDGSGSMLFDQALSASRAAGIVMNRLQAVIDGEAETYLRFFDARLREQEFHANSPESAQELLRIVTDPQMYKGRSTEFYQPLDVASRRAKEILASRSLKDPELFFVTDGGAEVPPLEILQGIKMHSVQVGAEENVELSNLSRTSGGTPLYTCVDLEAA